MIVKYQGRNTGITDAFRNHADPRIEGLPQYFGPIIEVKTVLSRQRHLMTVEITVDADGRLIRGEDRSPEALASFDKALNRVERQLRKYNEKLQSRGRQSQADKARAVESSQMATGTEQAQPPAPEELADINIVRTKSHALKPMSPEEAVLQMEMLGHDFFVFFDGQAEQVAVVYRRHDGDYGLIEPEIG